MTKADRVHSTPRRTASKIQTKRKLKRPAPGAAADPIFAAIEQYRKLLKASNDRYDALELAETKAKKKHGKRPWSLVAWRNYSAIGGSEIEDRRKEFLRLPGIDPKKIEKEYRDAKARERAGERAERVWDRRAGLAALRRENARAVEAVMRCALRMAQTKPRSFAGAAALLACTTADMESGETLWHKVALNNIIKSLAAWDKTPPAPGKMVA